MMNNTECKKTLLTYSMNGKIFKCNPCNKYYIEYKNLHFTFNPEEFDQFRQYFLQMDAEYWEYENKKSVYRRKIQVPIGHRNVIAMFNSAEVEELKSLLSSPFNKRNDFEIISNAQFEKYSFLN